MHLQKPFHQSGGTQDPIPTQTSLPLPAVKPKKVHSKIGWIVILILLAGFGWRYLTASKPIEQITPAVTDISDWELSDGVFEIQFTYTPADADVSKLSLQSDAPAIADVKLQTAENGSIVGMVYPAAVGSAVLSCASDTIHADAVTCKIVDTAAEKAEQERIAAEQRAEQEAAEKATAEKAEQERIAAEEKAAEEQTARETSDDATAASSSVKGDTVYITPNGKRYHRSATCGGKNAQPVDISAVGGRTPCKKCA